MKIGAIPENLLERLAMVFGLVPTPFIDTFHAVIVARAVMVATKLDVFDALASRPLSATELAAQLGLDAAALEKLLNVLVAIGYVKNGSAGFAPTRLTRKWLMRDSPRSIHDNMLLRFLEWQAIETTEEFVRTGKALDVHDLIRDEQWAVYQRGMRSLARLSAPEVAARTPCLGNPLTMLDVGGGHGAYSAAFCRRYPQLTATILDLPQAVEVAAPLVAEEDLEERIVHKAGNALTEDLGRAVWDIILVSHLVHHFSDAQNRSLLKRAAMARSKPSRTGEAPSGLSWCCSPPPPKLPISTITSATTRCCYSAAKAPACRSLCMQPPMPACVFPSLRACARSTWRWPRRWSPARRCGRRGASSRRTVYNGAWRSLWRKTNLNRFQNSATKRRNEHSGKATIPLTMWT